MSSVVGLCVVGSTRPGWPPGRLPTHKPRAVLTPLPLAVGRSVLVALWAWRLRGPVFAICLQGGGALAGRRDWHNSPSTLALPRKLQLFLSPTIMLTTGHLFPNVLPSIGAFPCFHFHLVPTHCARMGKAWAACELVASAGHALHQPAGQCFASGARHTLPHAWTELCCTPNVVPSHPVKVRGWQDPGPALACMPALTMGRG